MSTQHSLTRLAQALENATATERIDTADLGAVSRPLTAHQQRVTDNLSQLLEVLPPAIRQHLEREDSLEDLLEIVMDLGRIPEARFPERVVELGVEPIMADHIDFVVGRVGAFGKDNRAGIERTLHRISAIRNRQGRIVGLICRIGRAVYGTIDIIQDVVETGKSILLLGRPGRGKTTKLREVARVLSEELKKRVVIVDTSNEIAGDGDIPHPAIGRARRMQVASPEEQHNVMIEAVENHMPEVIVIDEIGTEQEAFAARTIAERGVQLVGTAHGNSLENLMMNPTLSDLVGGIHPVTLSDDEAKRRGTQKTVLERKAPPTFDVVIEIMEVDKLAIHHDVQHTVDRMLRGGQPRPEIRVRNASGEVEVVQRADVQPGRSSGPEYNTGSLFDDREPESRPRGENGAGGFNRPSPAVKPTATGAVRLFPYGVSRTRLERAIRTLSVPALIAKDLHDCDAIVALKANYRKEPAKLQEGISRNIPTFVIKSNTYIQIESALREIFGLPSVVAPSEEELAVQQVEEAIDEILNDPTQGLKSLELPPQNSFARRLQHQIAADRNMLSESIGSEPNRRVRISRP
jgi:stage III sporulation protein SpoIIIAA